MSLPLLKVRREALEEHDDEERGAAVEVHRLCLVEAVGQERE
eukprot:CAMPEP_0183405618 /NCGR_PEP_ID=MMETSP0370-20130417/15971_1 /TAXON_ID=268820 /ORGANISM="Peridinium aciculiferum, Strain PAER-2" /LENGTH=41 /DNA_ID= /DNA_START= /DNA_END= /DNA_ORIENTATION=